MNLMTKTTALTPNYYCTWRTQNRAKKSKKSSNAFLFEGDQGALGARNYLNEEIIFGENGWIYQYDLIRKDLYFCFDDGWDVPYNTDPGIMKYVFGSLIVEEERFPSFSGTPAERLKWLNDRTKAFGWRGAGIWIASQACGEGKDGFMMNDSQLEEYWRERARWSAYAGIEYWKVDWGVRSHDTKFRKMLTQIVHEEAPGLLVEHAFNAGPLNDIATPGEKIKCNNTGRFSNWGNILQRTLDTLFFSDVLRCYDVTTHLSIPSTLDRLAEIFKGASVEKGAVGLINCEDEVYIGAALGCSIGVMRSCFMEEVEGIRNDPLNSRKRIDEVIRCVRWQKLAPAFGAGATPTHVSFQVLDDSWTFRKGDTWAEWVIGTEVRQTAPAVISRGMKLPTIESEYNTPYVTASRNPNGAVSIATFCRVSSQKGFHMPLASVTMEIEEGFGPVGIFGRFNDLRIIFSENLNDYRIFGQDLMGEEAIDITERVIIDGKSVLIPGELIHEIGLMAASKGDLSEPGMALSLMQGLCYQLRKG